MKKIYKSIVIITLALNSKTTKNEENYFISNVFNFYVWRKNAYINLEVCFVETANAENVLAKFIITKSPGGMAFGTDLDTGSLIGEAYAKAAKTFSKYLLKQKAF